MDKLFIS